MNYLTHGLQAMDAGLMVLRVVVGCFFAISGWHKLFNVRRHDSLVATLIQCRVPYIEFNQWFVPIVELTGGVALVLGLLTLPATLGLIAICIVACCTDGIPNVTSRFHPIDKADWLDDVLYLPEALYLAMLVVVVLAGPGHYSLDRLFF